MGLNKKKRGSLSAIISPYQDMFDDINEKDTLDWLRRHPGRNMRKSDLIKPIDKKHEKKLRKEEEAGKFSILV
jgi:hypothetical protein